MGRARRSPIVGAGPAGLEAARVSAARGHEVILFEAAGNPGGQIRARNPGEAPRGADRHCRLARRAMRAARRRRCSFNTYAEAADVRGARCRHRHRSRPAACRRTWRSRKAPTLRCRAGTSCRGDVKPAEDVLLFDDNGAHPGMAAAEFIADAGVTLELVSPERFFAPEMGGLNLVPYMQIFTDKDVQDHHHDAGARSRSARATRSRRRCGVPIPRRDCGDAPRRSGGRRERNDARWPISISSSRKIRSIAARSIIEALIAGASADDSRQSRRPLPALPHRRCGRLAQHPCRDLRCAAVVQGFLICVFCARPVDNSSAPATTTRPARIIGAARFERTSGSGDPDPSRQAGRSDWLRTKVQIGCEAGTEGRFDRQPGPPGLVRAET